MANPKIRFKKEDGTEYPDWGNYIKLGDCSEFITKGATPTTYGFQWQSEGIPFFRNDAIKDNKFVYGDYSFISEEANDVLSRSEIRGGDLLIAITGDIGKVGIVPNEIERGNINQHIARVRIKQCVYSYFTYQYLCTTKVQKEYKKIKTGLSMPQLSLEQVRNTLIPRISLEEQKKIADFLSDIDKIIKQSEVELKNLEAQKKGAMQKIFSQEVRFKQQDGSDYPDWVEKKLEEVCFGFSSGQTPLREHMEYYTGNISWLSSGELNRGIVYSTKEHITEEAMNNTNLSLIPKGTFVMAITGLEAERVCGNCAILGIDTTLNQSCMYLYTYNDKILTEFLFQWYLFVGRLYGKKYCQGTKQQSYNAELVRILPITMPTSLSEQRQIADFFSTFDKSISSTKKELEKWKELKKGLLQQMFV